ncbi:MAG: hypothetical protein OEQ28_08725, partial [Acidobacteriota bacterium]|nr:hypothetical protein [Acidobacteriota bacterium]
MSRITSLILATALSIVLTSACSSEPEMVQQKVSPAPTPTPTAIPMILSEILDLKNTKSSSRLIEFDFLNYTYPLPRGWQDADGNEVELVDGARRMTKE